MWSNPKIIQPLSTPVFTPIQSPLPQILSLTASSASPLKQFTKLSRRDFSIFTTSSLLLLLGSHTLEPLHMSNARAEKVGTEENSSCANQTATKEAFLDVAINGEPVGRIIIGLYGDTVPFGAKRFSELVSGAAGVSYRRKEFLKIMPNYVQHGGLRSYGVDAELARKTGSNVAVDTLVNEWEKQNDNCSGTKNVATSVGIIVRDPSKPPPKIKLVARKGKLEIDEEEVGMDPNGTEFLIATKDSPELDASTLVVGRVLEGMDVVKRISEVKTVQENTGSPYFRVAKLIGDKRAVVAERGFNRPYLKVVITNCGLI
ncbi:peptidyl-prolyl cis-trans isomerase CYP26-2, chloroplastic [Olea europaea subsp. europaea]|uniref:Peptidyl-prolyl cis-trans isomerase CYP26-2, chloroplastic n=1 Tax=Olea europaea subsp. europaea TaxID=158383 RepID=A0A8S0RMZ1_OLEEU|nr:peptidyl-prolyl cis-trans isomerase CYP26-2, chloroplastic [Olea europaea subsp. europaea]